MKSLTALAGIGVLLLAAGLSRSQTTDRPALMSSQNWITITENLGFVITPRTSTQEGRLSASNAVSGYFMAKTSEGWRRLSMNEPVVVMPVVK